MPKSTITSKGQTTIPIEVRTFLGVQEGDTIDYIYEEKTGTVTIRPKKKTHTIGDLAGILHDPKREFLSDDEINRRLALYFTKKYKPRKKL